MKKCCPGFPIAFIIVFAIMIFLYYRYSFLSVSHINFSIDSFYASKNDKLELFIPKDKSYNLCFYSSYIESYKDFLAKNLQSNNANILAIDFYQLANNDDNRIVDLKISTNLMLKLIFEFDIKDMPKCFNIEANADNKMIYKSYKNDGFYKLINFRKE
ncbi:MULTISPECIES: hypothetical protein [Helicobacter]|uniref:Periplasmic protein n=1 Tax=Helicobacter ibis TaxID=2962633 RepID=A0ABT4VEB3_9HELI|nr:MULTISPECIES: hypothetical protein [Helicobacter]MDA3967514.1 hypothetical protein [Helicobacter sp. WB40]MDA3969046.1 hypothetical protein [Helicobacter ibis]